MPFHKHSNNFSHNQSEEDEICDAAADEEEPEAGSTKGSRMIMGIKINKFENNQGTDSGRNNFLKSTERECLKKFIAELAEIKRVKKLMKLK